MNKARLVIPALPGIGDMLLAHSLVQILHQQEPNAPIDIIATKHNEEVARRFPEIRNVLVIRRDSGKMHFGDFFTAVLRIKRRRYAACYSIQINPKFTLMPWLARIPCRVGFQRAKHSALLFTQTLPSTCPPKHMAYENASLANPGKNDFELPLPYLKFERDDSEKLPANLAELAATSDLVAICPGGVSIAHKRWPAPHYGQLVAWLVEQGMQVVILGSADDCEHGRHIMAHAKTSSVHDLTGKTSLVHAMSLLSHCRALVSNDTGIMHVGAALGIVTLGVFTSTNPWMFAPLGKRAHYLAPRQPSAHSDALTSQQVIDKLKAIL